MKYQYICVYLILAFLGVSCSSNKAIKKAPIETNHSAHVQSSLIESNEKFDQHFYGLVIYDPETKDTLLNINGDKYFTPASNTKLLTFLLSKKLLSEHLIGLEYMERGDSLIFRGTGDPGFLADSIYGTAVLEFLQKSNRKLFYDPSNYLDKRLGSGWAWDDSKYLYQKNKNGLPIYGNEFSILKTESSHLSITPKLFQDSISHDTTRKYAVRSLSNNIVNIDTTGHIDWSYPIYQSNHLAAKLLADTLGREVKILSVTQPNEWQGIQGSSADSLYKNLLLKSDNYIAEQLLLHASSQVLGYMNTRDIINYGLDSILVEIPDKPRWVDGSGLSRYNLVTPRSMIWVLQEIKNLVTEEQIKVMFPSGKNGDTLPMKYETDPFIFAKTGTLSNNHNISGYLYTKSDKMLIFSFMNNHYMYPKEELVSEMKNVLEYLRDNF